MTRPTAFPRSLFLGPLLAAGFGLSGQAVLAQVVAPQTVPPTQGVPPGTPPAPAPGVAVRPDPQEGALLAALRLPDLVQVMHEEGLNYGKQLADQLFPGDGGAAWQDTVRRIYDPKAMEASFAADFGRRLTPAERGTILRFLTSPLGRRVVTLEISARRALLDPDVESHAEEMVRRMAAEHSPRLLKLRVFADVNGLVEANVAGALNANYAFYTGLAEGHAPGLSMSHSQILSDVAGQEGQVRRETRAWLYPFLATAYKPLSDADLERYIAFSRTPAGKALNRALFASFDSMFDGISHRLGLAAAEVLSGQNL